eukprot:6198813-Pleurochrysis_carterae.AAC.1
MTKACSSSSSSSSSINDETEIYEFIKALLMRDASQLLPALACAADDLERIALHASSIRTKHAGKTQNAKGSSGSKGL